MVIATITPAKEPRIPGVPIPISQISIELFRRRTWGRFDWWARFAGNVRGSAPSGLW